MVLRPLDVDVLAPLMLVYYISICALKTLSPITNALNTTYCRVHFVLMLVFVNNALERKRNIYQTIT